MTTVDGDNNASGFTSTSHSEPHPQNKQTKTKTASSRTTTSTATATAEHEAFQDDDDDKEKDEATTKPSANVELTAVVINTHDDTNDNKTHSDVTRTTSSTKCAIPRTDSQKVHQKTIEVRIETIDGPKIIVVDVQPDDTMDSLDLKFAEIKVLVVSERM